MIYKASSVCLIVLFSHVFTRTWCRPMEDPRSMPAGGADNELVSTSAATHHVYAANDHHHDLEDDDNHMKNIVDTHSPYHHVQINQGVVHPNDADSHIPHAEEIGEEQEHHHHTQPYHDSDDELVAPVDSDYRDIYEYPNDHVDDHEHEHEDAEHYHHHDDDVVEALPPADAKDHIPADDQKSLKHHVYRAFVSVNSDNGHYSYRF